MHHKRLSNPREAPKKRPRLGLVIALAAAGGMIIGSAGTYFFSKQFASPAVGGTPQAQTTTLPPTQQFTPAPQPPGPVPPGKVWSVEHGHWHDVSGAQTIPTPAPAPATVTPSPVTIPAAPPQPAAAAPAEKKE